MDYAIEVLEKSFDYYFISMIVLGNAFVWHLGFYPQWLLNKKKSKVYLTALHSLVFGFIYHYLTVKSGAEADLKIMLNSFLLATSLYEFGLKEVIEWLKSNGSKLVIKKIQKEAGEETSNDLNEVASNFEEVEYKKSKRKNIKKEFEDDFDEPGEEKPIVKPKNRKKDKDDNTSENN
jgi:hypothetical protein